MKLLIIKSIIMKNVKQISGNSLSELITLMSNIEGLIQQYSHVSEFLPKPLVDAIKNTTDKFESEYDRREEEAFNP